MTKTKNNSVVDTTLENTVNVNEVGADNKIILDFTQDKPTGLVNAFRVENKTIYKTNNTFAIVQSLFTINAENKRLTFVRLITNTAFGAWENINNHKVLASNVETNETSRFVTDEQIEKRISSGILNFISHGIDNSIPKEFSAFKVKYGIGLIKENCVIDPVSFKRAGENNIMNADYLNKKYGEDWLKELPTKPFGIK